MTALTWTGDGYLSGGGFRVIENAVIIVVLRPAAVKLRIRKDVG